MAGVDTTWTPPATAISSGGLDGATDDNISPEVWDKLVSNLNRLGGATGEVGEAITKNNVQQGQLVNEIMGFPAIVPHASNLVTLALWWANVATGATTYVDLITEGIAETYGRWALKHVAAASGDGPKQVFTYANQPRVKSGRKLSHLYAVYIVTAARSVTPKVLNSDATVSTGTVISTVGSWVLGAIEDHSLAGASTDVRWTMDGAGTFYVIPLGTCTGPKAFALAPRPLRWVDTRTGGVYNADPGGATFFDLDLTASTSPLTVAAQITAQYVNTTTAGRRVAIRRNGDTSASNTAFLVGGYVLSVQCISSVLVCLDDGQVCEIQSDGPAGDTETLYLIVAGFWEWA